MNEIQLPPFAQGVFNPAVWKIAREIPTGKVFTYGQIAELIPLPAGIAPDAFQAFRARWAGSAMAECPADVPWQRVVNSQGKISPRRGAENQRRLLEAEGIEFDARDRINLARFGWAGPDEDWLKSNGLVAPPKIQDSLF
jgi:methylated-DNA-protein-cysteine methyltransferase-like protein